MSVKSPLPLVGIPADVREVGIHPMHAVGEKYINAVAHGSRVLPVLIPALGPGRDLDSLLETVDLEALVARLDGLFLPGSPSNVEPWRYSGENSRPGTLHDAQRDATTLPLIRVALDAGLPLLGICRGLQEVNVALGGTLHQNIQEVPGKLDHREDPSHDRSQQYAPAHRVRFVEGGELARLTGVTEAQVNSIHAQGVDRLASGLVAEAIAPDGVIEAFRVAEARAFALAVQWHAEWRYAENPVSRAVFAAFGEAARKRAEGRIDSAPIAASVGGRG